MPDSLSLICQKSRSFCLPGRYGGATANDLTAKIQNYARNSKISSFTLGY